jgi:hypothetical protein
MLSHKYRNFQQIIIESDSFKKKKYYRSDFSMSLGRSKQELVVQTFFIISYFRLRCYVLRPTAFIGNMSIGKQIKLWMFLQSLILAKVFLLKRLLFWIFYSSNLWEIQLAFLSLASSLFWVVGSFIKKESYKLIL